MGTPESIFEQRAVDPITGIRTGEAYAGARGECLEDPCDGVTVQLGCGHKPWAGWINIDGERGSRYADLVADLKSIPLATGGADVAVAIHVLEHFYAWEVPEVLSEWKRILKPGGMLIVELPCMDKVIRYMSQCIAQQHAFAMPMTWWAMWGDPKYKDPAMCHKWGYTEGLLKYTLETAGFTNVQAADPRYHVKQRDMRMTAIKGDL